MVDITEHLLDLARNNRWSNHRLHRACAKLSEEEYFARRRSFFGSIHATLDHVLLVDLLYLGRLKGERRVPDDCDTLCRSLTELTERQDEVDCELIGYCAGQSPESLASRVTFVRSNGQIYSERVLDVLTHLFLHQVHHRAQVHDMLSSTAVAPPQLDEFFLAGDLELRREELRALGLPER